MSSFRFIFFISERWRDTILSQSGAWLLLIIVFILIITATFYFRWLHDKFEKENKMLGERLSERTHQVMVQKWELERKNHAITEKNQEIFESLRYASNIQMAVLPREDVVISNFADAFILYKPKDIVSGDFYFFTQTGNKQVIAVADCTGHGVAGAFMSMVGSSLLHQIINQEKMIRPDEILHHLDESIVDALRQREQNSHGGMDIALCCLEPDKNEMQFAGANRPLWRIRNNELKILPPDKIPIGGFRRDGSHFFTNHSIDLAKGDCVYLFSDGYADQFGGEEGKKIMTKKFRELVQSIHHKEMKEQKELLNEYFETWKGKFEQVDDVLVIGFRV